jgi:hypothetical protein
VALSPGGKGLNGPKTRELNMSDPAVHAVGLALAESSY